MKQRIDQKIFEVGKLPPQALDMEEAVLGALMLEREALDVIDILSPDTFYTTIHRTIFEAIQKLHKENSVVDILTVVNELNKVGKLEEVGGAYGVTLMTNKVASSGNIEHHALVLVEMQMRRGLIAAGTTAIREAYELDNMPLDITAKVHEEVQKLEDIVISRKNKPTIEALSEESEKQYFAREDARKHNKITGVTTGLRELNKSTGGWQDQDLIITAARPGMGKTALACLFALAAAHEGTPVELYSLEMSDLKITDRLLLFQSGISADKFKHGELSESEKMSLSEARKVVSKLPIYIDDTPAISPEYLRSKAGKRKRSNGLGLIIVDYLQLMRVQNRERGMNREQEISFISSSLKALAKSLNIPVIALAQLSRAVETRGGDKRPQLSDLRESGSIEQDADIVLFPHRPEYYGFTEDAEGNSVAGIGEIIIEKHRNGAVTKPQEILFRCNGSLTQIIDYSTESALEPNIGFINQNKNIPI